MRTAEEIKKQVKESESYWVAMLAIIELLSDIRELLLGTEGR